MRYQVIYDTPGRLRVRCGQYAFSQEQGYGIASLLFARKGVKEVTTRAVNGSILIYYEIGAKEDILRFLNGLQRENIPTVEEPDCANIQRVDDWFQKQLVRLLVRRFLVRTLVPSPIRFFLTVLRALRYWRSGWNCLMRGHMGVEVLDAVSIGAAMCQGSHNTASSIMFLLSLSGLLEEYTRQRTRGELTNSLAIHVDQVWLVDENGKEVPIPMSQLAVHNCIRVRAGSLIPVDGVVIQGEAMVNESAMTGESLAVRKAEGAAVYAGTTVEEGAIQLQVTALTADSRISQIVDLIDQSEELKAGVQSRAERLADAIVPFSFLGAVVVALITRNLTKALSVLMVDYSCAIKLSTPIAVISAMREASLHHMMVKGGKYLEAFASADTIVFDKTGTLTEACPKVVDIIPFGDYTREEVLRISACIEEHFPHSMARAVVRRAEEEGLHHEEEHAEVEYVVAHGVSTRLHGQKAMIGSYHFIFEDEKTLLDERQQQEVEKAINGHSALYLAINGKLAGIICISDPPRKEAAQVIAQLRQLGVEHVVMMTGDHENAARQACRQMGIHCWWSQVLPEDKATLVTRLKEQGRRVIMVGDGINDSPALAAADVSVAMKDSSDLAREVADITLLSADLEELVILRKLSVAMMQRIQRNYRLILQFNSLLLGLGLGGILQPATTALLHNVSTMAISAGSMRLYLKEKTQ